MHREGALDANAVAHLAHGVGLRQPAALATDHVALEDLDALLVALDHLHVDLDLVAGTEVRKIGAEVLAVDEIGGLHGENILRAASGNG